MTGSIKNSLSVAHVSETHDSNLILMALDASDPLDHIMRLYDGARDKKCFALALAAVALQRHRQWQALAEHDLR